MRRRLPYGSIAKIADRENLSPRIVTEVLMMGWHKHLRNQVVAAAMDLISSEHPDSELLKRADSMKLSTDNYYSAPYPIKKKGKKGDNVSHPMDWFQNNPIVMVVIGLAFIMLLFGKRIFSAMTKPTIS